MKCFVSETWRSSKNIYQCFKFKELSIWIQVNEHPNIPIPGNSNQLSTQNQKHRLFLKLCKSSLEVS